MAGVSEDELTPLMGWPQGINNKAKEHALPDGTLRAADNVDLDNEGKMQVRPGRALISSITNLHSVWSHPQYPFMLAAAGNHLYSWDDNLDLEQLSDVITAVDAPVSYDFKSGSVYWTNGTDSGRIFPDFVNLPWAPEAPGGQPTVTATTGAGGLYAGTYQLAITYLDDRGRESGSTLATEVQLADGQGITLTDIPQPQGSDTAYIRIYLSGQNGEILYWVRNILPGLSTVTIGVHTPGKQLEMQFLKALPAGQITKMHNGRHLVARGKVLIWAEADHYGMGKLHANYLSFDDTITLMEPVGQASNSGLYVAAGKRTYYLQGSDPKNWQKFIAYTQGAVPRTSAVAEASDLGFQSSGPVPYWLDKNGQYVVGLPGGVVSRMHEKNYSAPANVQSGASAMREYQGMKHLIASLRGGSQTGIRATDSISAEIFTNGIRQSS